MNRTRRGNGLVKSCKSKDKEDKKHELKLAVHSMLIRIKPSADSKQLRNRFATTNNHSIFKNVRECLEAKILLLKYIKLLLVENLTVAEVNEVVRYYNYVVKTDCSNISTEDFERFTTEMSEILMSSIAMGNKYNPHTLSHFKIV